MNVFIVLAHHETQSFSGALKNKAVEFFLSEGHQVKLSDLYAMNFKAEADRKDFIEVYQPAYLRYYREQYHAYEKSAFSEDIREEQEKLLWADLLILQFPMWWYSFPAILKGWVDRVLAYGFCYGKGKGAFETGFFKGKKGMVSVTKGGMVKPGLTTDADEETEKELYHIHQGIFAFMGMEVLPPFVAYGIPRSSEEERAVYLQQFEERLKKIH